MRIHPICIIVITAYGRMAASIHAYTLKRGKARTKQATSLTFDELEYFVAARETSEAPEARTTTST
jgi:hypothetical protein